MMVGITEPRNVRVLVASRVTSRPKKAFDVGVASTETAVTREAPPFQFRGRFDQYEDSLLASIRLTFSRPRSECVSSTMHTCLGAGLLRRLFRILSRLACPKPRRRDAPTQSGVHRDP